MKITPIDIRQQQFGRSFRGLDSHEVDSFLYLVSQEIEVLLKENHQLKEELAHNSRIVGEYRERERALKETMITAQKITDDIKESAQKEAEVILSRAELQAEKIIHAANDRLVKIIEDINETKRQRNQFHSNLVGIIEAHRKLLAEVEEEKSESLFLSIEELKHRRARLHAIIQEALEAHANLLSLDRDKEVEDLREETERLERMRLNLASRLHAAIDNHAKLLGVRKEAENHSRRYQIEDNLKVLKKPEAASRNSMERTQTPNESATQKEAESK